VRLGVWGGKGRGETRGKTRPEQIPIDIEVVRDSSFMELQGCAGARLISKKNFEGGVIGIRQGEEICVVRGFPTRCDMT